MSMCYTKPTFQHQALRPVFRPLTWCIKRAKC